MTEAPFVYGLVDPQDTGHVRYVGMAMQPRRPYEHAKAARRLTKHSHLYHWIRLLQSEGREPSVLVLEKLPSYASRSFVGEIEKMYIASLRSIGHRLTNVSPGGWGGSDLGRTLSLETRQRMSDAKVGVRHHWRGEERGGAKLTEEQVLAIRADSRTKSEIARAYSVSVPTIIDIKLRKKWDHVEGPPSVPSRNGRLTPWNVGKHHSEESRQMMSESQTAAWAWRKGEKNGD